MPQFDPAVWSPQLVWLAISFIALYIVMSRVVLPRISAVLEEREFRINDALRKAEALKREAEDAALGYEKLMAEARAKAHDAVQTVRDDAAAKAAERHAELSSRLGEELTAAEARIAAARTQAVAGIRDIAVDIAGAAAERLLGEPLTKRVVTSAVDAVMKEIR
jgi:F-type H+-transporting ATPase subunit b